MLLELYSFKKSVVYLLIKLLLYRFIRFVTNFCDFNDATRASAHRAGFFYRLGLARLIANSFSDNLNSIPLALLFSSSS